MPLLFLLAAGNNKDYVLAQNSDIYFPGRTNTNTNSVHNVVAELNRNNVMAFLNQPQQVNLPGPQANPFQSASNRPPQQQSSSNVNGQGFLPSSNQNTHSASLPSIIRPAPPVHQQNTLASVTSRPQSEVFFPIKQQQQHNLPTPTVSQVSWVQPNGASNTIGRPPSNSATSPLAQSGPFESGFQYAQGGQSSDPYVAFAIKLFEVRLCCNSSCFKHPSRNLHFGISERKHRYSEPGAQPHPDTSIIGAITTRRQRPHPRRHKCSGAESSGRNNSLDFVPKIHQLATDGHRVCIDGVRRERWAAQSDVCPSCQRCRIQCRASQFPATGADCADN